LPLNLVRIKKPNLNFAGPGRLPGYFPCSSKESNQRKDVRLAAGTPFAVISTPAVSLQITAVAHRREEATAFFQSTLPAFAQSDEMARDFHCCRVKGCQLEA
jgi:hypothetical protein